MNRSNDSKNTRIDDIDALGDQIAELAAQIEAANYQLLCLIQKFDQQEGWARCGMRSCAHWLSWRIGVGLNAARERVRVARALAELPLCSEAMQRGEVSFSKLRAITRVATCENEDKLLTYAQHGTATQVEKIVRRYRGVLRAQDPAAAEKSEQGRYLKSWTDDHGMLVIEGRLPPELAAPVLKALELAQAHLSAKGVKRPTGSTESSDDDCSDVTAVTSSEPTMAQRRADALALVAQSALDHQMRCGSGGDRTQVVLHVDAEALAQAASRSGSKADGPGQCCFEGEGGDVSAKAARRLSCDASLVTLQHKKDGSVLDVGRKTRTIPPAIRRALLARDDHHCRFPGCTHDRFLQGHHLRHWADGGETKLQNLLLACSHHHKLLHEGGFCVTADDDGRLTFFDPHGRRLPAVPSPPPLSDDPTASLVSRNRKRGLEISDESLRTWRGEPLDYGWAVDILLQGQASMGS